VTKGIEGFAFNKAIAKLYAFTNTCKRRRPDRRRCNGDAARWRS
jgi:hypothetical protein